MSVEGKIWESRAEQFLLSQGLVLITRNFSTRSGEIDLIMRDDTHIAFIEVRFRSTIRFGGAVGSVTRAKQKKTDQVRPSVSSEKSSMGNSPLPLRCYRL